MIVETQEQADQLNRDGTIGPYGAANGHVMVAPVFFPIDRDAYDKAYDEWARGDDDRRPPHRSSFERDYKIGDRVQYSSSNAYCAPGCDHRELGPLEDW